MILSLLKRSKKSVSVFTHQYSETDRHVAKICFVLCKFIFAIKGLSCCLWAVAKLGCSGHITGSWWRIFSAHSHICHTADCRRGWGPGTDLTCKYWPQHMWHQTSDTRLSCSAHGTHGAAAGTEKVGHRAPRSRDDKTQTGSFETIRMSADDITGMCISEFSDFKTKIINIKSSLENEHKELTSYLTSLKIIIQPSVGEQWSFEWEY